MKNTSLIRASFLVAGLLLSFQAARADRPAWCPDGVLMETKFFDDAQQARDFANAQSATAVINGVTHCVIATVNVVASATGNRVYVVHVWDCPKAKPAENGGGKKEGGAGADKPEKVTYTLDPHPELDRNGKRRDPKANAGGGGGKAGGATPPKQR